MLTSLGAINLKPCPIGLMRLKPAESLKLVFQWTVSPLSAIMSFLTPLTNLLVVSAEAWTQGQLIWFQPMNKQVLYSLPKITNPRPYPIYIGSHSTPIASSSSPKRTSWYQGLNFASDVKSPPQNEHGQYVACTFTQWEYSAFPVNSHTFPCRLHQYYVISTFMIIKNFFFRPLGRRIWGLPSHLLVWLLPEYILPLLWTRCLSDWLCWALGGQTWVQIQLCLPQKVN